MASRKRLTLDERMAVYQKFGGHCAYCGIEIRFEEMQCDHVVPLEGWSERGADSLENMFPACKSCNHYKRANSLEGWRKVLESMPHTLNRDSYTYRQAVRFGLVKPTPKSVVFYFEKMDTHCSVMNSTSIVNKKQKL